MTRLNGHRLKDVILQSTKIVTISFINKTTIITYSETLQYWEISPPL